jgi:hypothetical protein
MYLRDSIVILLKIECKCYECCSYKKGDETTSR